MGAGAEVGGDRDREVVRERQDPEHAVVRCEAQHRVGGGDAGECRRMREHDPFRVGGRARAEADEGGIDGGEAGGGRWLAIAPGERPRRAVLGNADDSAHGDRAQDLLALGIAQIARDRDEATAGREDAERDADVGERVAADEREARCAPDARRTQRVRDGVGGCQDLRVRQRRAARDVGQRRSLRMPIRRGA